MADYLIQDTTLDAIADAINAKTGGSSAMTPAEMVTEIGNISGGGADVTKDEWTMASKFTGTCKALYDAYVDNTFEGVQLLSLADGGTTRNDFSWAMIWIYADGGTLQYRIVFRGATGVYNGASSNQSAWMEAGSTLTRYKISATVPA